MRVNVKAIRVLCLVIICLFCFDFAPAPDISDVEYPDKLRPILSPSADYICGDWNADGAVNILDIVYLLNYLYQDGPVPPIDIDAGDMDSIRGISVHDAQFLIEYIYRVDDPPYCPPFPDSTIANTNDGVMIKNTKVPPFTTSQQVEIWVGPLSTDTLMALALALKYKSTGSNLVCTDFDFSTGIFDISNITIDTIYPARNEAAFAALATIQKLYIPDSALVGYMNFTLDSSPDTEYIYIDTTGMTRTKYANMISFAENGLKPGIPIISGLNPFSVHTTSPSQNELDVYTTHPVEVKFGFDVDETTITSNSFVVRGNMTGEHQGALGYDGPTRTVTYLPTAINYLTYGEIVTVSVTDDIQSDSGDLIEGSFTWTFTNAADAGSGFFEIDTVFSVNNAPITGALADYDNDGDIDAVLSAEINLSVIENDGNANFTFTSGNEVLGYPMGICAADFNRDDRMDLATANVNTDNVTVLFGNGDCTFNFSGNYDVGSDPGSVISADFDGDGDMDIAVANQFDDNISILLNHGNGSFDMDVTYDVCSDPNDLRSGDFDNDGDIDIVTTDHGSDSLTVLFNAGDGAFPSKAFYPAGNLHGDISVADLDKDGDLEIIATTTENLNIFINNGGVFDDTVVLEVESFPKNVNTGDFDADGDIDLVTANYNGSVSVFLNSGDLEFANEQVFSVGRTPRSIYPADLNDDGSLDFFVIYSSGGIFDTALVMLNTSDIRVTNLENAGTGSLRSAIEMANSSAGTDSIVFDTSGLILLTDPLPILTDDSTYILGSTSPQGAHYVILDGSGVSVGPGLGIISSGNYIEGLSIANFPGAGVKIWGMVNGNTITNNLIYKNGHLGINLGNDHVTPNDMGDVDDGPNDLLNFPEMDSIVMQPDSSFIVYGAACCYDITIEFFVAHYPNDDSFPEDTSGHGEAYSYIGSANSDVMDTTFQFVVPNPYEFYTVLTATATDTLGNTSEFSENFALIPSPLIVVAYSPVNIIVINPNLLEFGKESNGDLIEEYPGEYHETPNDSVVIKNPIPGTYEVRIVAEDGAPSGATYSAIIKVDGSQQATLAVDQDVPADGALTSFEYDVEEGYHYLNGDANRDEALNVGDAVFLINYVFKNGPAPEPLEAGEANCDLAINVGDAVYMINYVFKSGPVPCYFEP
ncbi:MAG: hypothetical protein GY841_07950 [FCB group bacterium]|nr:hypothetical protein [FCB group bacterium]